MRRTGLLDDVQIKSSDDCFGYCHVGIVYFYYVPQLLCVANIRPVKIYNNRHSATSGLFAKQIQPPLYYLNNLFCSTAYSLTL